MWIIILTLTLLLIFTVVYILWLIRRMNYISQEVYTLLELTSEYERHLNKVYNLPLFYEDATLKELLKHTQYHAESCREFGAVFASGFEEVEDDDELEEGNPDRD